METGHSLIKTSLILQLVVALCFIMLAGVFHRRCSRHGVSNKQLVNTLATLYVSISLIVVRTIFRTVEYFGIAEYRFSDPDFDPMSMSPLLRYEVYFYVFEGALMLCNNVMFNIRHPRRYLPQDNKIYLSPDGVTEIEGSGYADSRPFWRTLFDPFDLVGMAKRRKDGPGAEANYWEGQVSEGK